MESGKVEEEGKFSDQVCGGSEVHRGGKKEWNEMWKERSPHPRRDRQTDRQGTCNSASRGGLDRERESGKKGLWENYAGPLASPLDHQRSVTQWLFLLGRAREWKWRSH